MTTIPPTSSRAARALSLVLLGLIVLAVATLARSRHPARSAAGPLLAMAATAAGTTQPGGERRKPNRLLHEKSPYLLQHAYNPVDWYPWGEEAFAKARHERKPIFLSIGYSTCHWCHVMERESFEDDSVAALLNRYFVAIKVDREERPDVDRIYMTAVQAMGMGGGWPLNAFLTPDLEPFYGGTYFPPRSIPGRPGMTELLPHIHEVWEQQHEQLVANGRKVMEALDSLATPDAAAADRESLFAQCARYLAQQHDSKHGGFGTAPKFPSVVNLNFLMRWGAREPELHRSAIDMVLGQLSAMADGGIHDQVGGGFHRYSTDAEWLVPHFEKMLYDQAQLAWAYLEAHQVRGVDAEPARGIFTYVARDLTSPEGAFYSAEDADSEGEEGKFYVWTPAEIGAVVGHEEAELVCQHYGVTEGGNFEHGTSILHVPTEEPGPPNKTPGEIVERSVLSTLDDPLLGEARWSQRNLPASRVKLLEARSRRVRPHRDDKVITAWNGLMISAFARGARVLDDPALCTRAERAAEFIWTRLHDERTGELTRRWRDGEAKGAGQLDDYAYYALGLVDLYQASLDPKWLTRANSVIEAMIARFWDEKDGGFFESPARDPNIKVRLKDGFDGAEMAGNSIAAYDLQLLGTLLDRREWLEKAHRTFDYFARRLASGPAAMPQMLVAMDLAQAAPRHIVIAGRPGAPDTRAMIAAVNRQFLPHDVLLFVDGGERQKALAALAPFVAPLVMKDGKATAYVCQNYACRLPTTDPGALGTQLSERVAAAGGKR